MLEEENVVHEEVSAPRAPRPAPKKRGVAAIWAVAILILAVVGFAGARMFGLLPSSLSGAAKVASTDPSATVATVNGAVITRGELDQKIAQVKKSTPPGGTDPTADAGFELQLLDDLVNLKLLTAAAEAKGLTVSDDEINTELTGLVNAMGGEDKFMQQLTATGLTRDELSDNIKNELLVRKLVDQETDIKNATATPEEIATAYQQAAASAPEGQEVPPIDQAAEILRAQIIQQKSSAIVNDYIQKLRADADIKVLL